MASVRRGLGASSREGSRPASAYGGIPTPPETSPGAGGFAGFDDGARTPGKLLFVSFRIMAAFCSGHACCWRPLQLFPTIVSHLLFAMHAAGGACSPSLPLQACCSSHACC